MISRNIQEDNNCNKTTFGDQTEDRVLFDIRYLILSIECHSIFKPCEKTFLPLNLNVTLADSQIRRSTGLITSRSQWNHSFVEYI